jgi:hypothetical protein
MTNTNRSHRRKQRQERRLEVRSIRRRPPDLKKLAGALIELAEAQAEADAEAQQARRQAAQRRRTERRQEADEPDNGPTGGSA